jgi:hypothetical protein
MWLAGRSPPTSVEVPARRCHADTARLGDSARRKLAAWVRFNRPDWNPAPEIEGDWIFTGYDQQLDTMSPDEVDTIIANSLGKPMVYCNC